MRITKGVDEERCAPSWQLWSSGMLSFPAAIKVYLCTVPQHAAFLRRAVDHGRACDRVKPLRWPPAGVLAPADGPGEDLVLGSRWLGDLVQAIGGWNV